MEEGRLLSVGKEITTKESSLPLFPFINSDVHSTCADEGLGACGEAMTNDVASLCAVGSGLFAASSIQIVAQVFGLLAVVLSEFSIMF